MDRRCPTRKFVVVGVAVEVFEILVEVVEIVGVRRVVAVHPGVARRQGGPNTWHNMAVWHHLVLTASETADTIASST